MSVIGFSAFALDILHAIYLGPAQDFIGAALWALISADVWGVGAQNEAKCQVAVLRIRHELWAHYKKNKGTQTQLEDLTLSMLGSRAKPAFKAKGAETKGALPFAVELLRRHQCSLGTQGKVLLGCGEALLAYIEHLAQAPRVVDRAQLQGMFSSISRFFRLWIEAGLPRKPKLHLMAHIVERTSYSGNPSMHAAFLDESLNKVLASIGRVAKRNFWEIRVFSHFEGAEDFRVEKRTRKK
jgi:hypothetical protein